MFGQKKREILTSLVQPVLSEAEYRDFIVNALADRRAILDAALSQLMARAEVLTEAAARLVETLQTGRKVLIAGNGGSAAEAQHFATELVGRFKRERVPYAVLSLTTDTSILTAVANDYGFQDVFARQVSAFGQPGDLLIVFSTSGESENLIRATIAGRQRLMTTVAVTGDRPNHLAQLADVAVRVPAVEADIVQELHLTVLHILCEIAESKLAACAAEAWKGDGDQ
ncbi:MAG TPA: SIS domain-containing protein [Ktedonobacteraceae bacterium]|nr:SIS domain-containing protein [Ktedonobacteraceae bacterium]